MNPSPLTPRTYSLFELKITLIYVVTSLTGTACIGALVITLCCFLRPELELLLLILAVDLPIVGAIQWGMNRRWFRETRRFFRDPQGSPSPSVFQELLEFPWKGSLLSLGLWLFSLVAIVGTRPLFLNPLPLHRTIILGLSIISGALLAWTLQYFLFHWAIRSFLDLFPHAPSSFSFKTHPIVRKYSLLFGAFLLGSAIFGGVLFSGTLYNALVSRFFKSSRDLFFLQLKQLSLSPQASLPPEYFLLDHPSPDALPIESFLEEHDFFFGIPVYTYEIQEIPPTWAFTAPVTAEGKTRHLEYRVNTDFLRAHVKELYVQMTILTFSLVLSFTFILVLLFLDLTRPLRRLRRELPDPSLPYTPPPLFLSDDELLESLVMVRQMFLRFSGLCQKISDHFWKIKDLNRDLSQNLSGFLSLSTQHGNALQAVAREFMEFREKAINQLQLKEIFLTNLRETGQRLPHIQAQWPKQSETLITELIQIFTQLATLNEEIQRYLDKLQQILVHYKTRTGTILELGKLTEVTIERLKEGIAQGGSAEAGFLPGLHSLLPLAPNPAGEQLSGEGFLPTLHHLEGKWEEFYLQMDTWLEEIFRISEAIDTLGFEAIMVSSREPLAEGEFRVVGEEVRDLADRARADMGIFARRMKEIFLTTKENLEKLKEWHRSWQRGMLEYAEAQGHLEEFLSQWEKNLSAFEAPSGVEEMISRCTRILEEKIAQAHSGTEQKILELEKLLELWHAHLERHQPALEQIVSQAKSLRSSLSALEQDLQQWLHRLISLEEEMGEMGKAGNLLSKFLQRMAQQLSELKDAYAIRNEWWSNIQIQIESIAQEISYREGLVKRITQAVSKKK